MVIREERTGIEKKFYDLCAQVCSEEGLELYDLDYFPGNSELRVFIRDKETKTALIEDCVKIDRALTPHIDTLEWMPAELTLEVSSPGVYRVLNQHHHFEECLGDEIQLVMKKKMEGEGLPKKVNGQKKFVALLKEKTDEALVVELEGTKLTLLLKDIAKANLEMSHQE